MTERVILVSTVGGWVSFGDLAELSVVPELNGARAIEVRRAGERVGYFRDSAWYGYVIGEKEDMPPDDLAIRRLAHKKENIS